MPVSFIEHQGQRILLLDFARIRDPQIVLREIEEARKFIAQQPRRKELLTLADVSKLRFNDDVLKAFRELTKHDEPYEKAAAVFGLIAIPGRGALAWIALSIPVLAIPIATNSMMNALAPRT